MILEKSLLIPGQNAAVMDQVDALMKASSTTISSNPEDQALRPRVGGGLYFDIGTGVPPRFFKPTLFMYIRFQKCIPIHV